MSPIKWLLMGALSITVGIILLVSVVLPQMHTGYTYVNNTMTEMTGGASIWGVLELMVTIIFFFAGLTMAGFGIAGEMKGRGRSRRKAVY